MSKLLSTFSVLRIPTSYRHSLRLIRKFPNSHLRDFALRCICNSNVHDLSSEDLSPEECYTICLWSYSIQQYVEKHPFSSIQPSNINH